jgi:retron-type reverse transcriptase
MSLGQLLLDLTQLLEAPEDNRAKIIALLHQNQSLAEFEVARYLVVRTIGHDLTHQIRSIDPRERLEGVRAIPLVCPRNVAAKLLRSVFKDPDQTVRKHARHVARKLSIADIALNDARFEDEYPNSLGAFNPSGWAFGVYQRQQNGSHRVTRLRAHRLPPLANRADVAAFVGTGTDDAAWSRLLRPGAQPGSAYIEFEVPKATGGTRRIAAPRKPLRKIQRKILDDILAKVPVHDAAHGFRPARSTVTNATPHLKAAIVVKMDLVDFFPSIHYRRVIGLFEELGYSSAVAEMLAGVCTYRPKLADGRMVWPGLLPQGAPSSPAITNLVCRRLDARLSALAARAGGTYTRYADDLTFSFAREPEKLGRFLWWVDQVCQQEGFTENTKKRRVLRASGQQRITGVVVNEHLAIPRKVRHRFRAIVANVGKNGLAVEAAKTGRTDLEAYLHGFVAYAKMVQPELGAKLARDVAKALGK